MLLPSKIDSWTNLEVEIIFLISDLPPNLAIILKHDGWAGVVYGD